MVFRHESLCEFGIVDVTSNTIDLYVSRVLLTTTITVVVVWIQKQLKLHDLRTMVVTKIFLLLFFFFVTKQIYYFCVDP
jgi:hypothetical protein